MEGSKLRSETFMVNFIVGNWGLWYDWLIVGRNGRAV